jgi:hypothetical protein
MILIDLVERSLCIINDKDSNINLFEIDNSEFAGFVFGKLN